MTHTTLLIVGAAVLTALLALLVFGSKGSAEDERLREEQKLLRALEAQRRVRNAQRLRTERRRPRVAAPQAPRPVEPEPAPEREAEPEPASVAAVKPGRREAGRQRKAERAERRAAAEDHKRQEKARAAAEKAQREADAEARRRAEDERRAALAAERQREAEEQARAESDPPVPDPADEAEKPLSELPLFSWANRIENEDRTQSPRRNT